MTYQQAWQALNRPNRNPFEGDVSGIDLRKLRQGLGLTPVYAAALLGVSLEMLVAYEGRDPDFDAEFTREALAGYAVHMAAWWGADQLHLQASNLDGPKRSRIA